MNHFSKLNSFRDINFQKWSITDESLMNMYETDNLHYSSVIDHFWKFITRKILGFEKWFTTHFLPHGHRKKMSAFLFPFSTLLVNIFHAEHLVRFFNDHPLFVLCFFVFMLCFLLFQEMWTSQEVEFLVFISINSMHIGHQKCRKWK